jgi:peptidoglycan/xylan/chitin deacetylase (PgdA/CDA1 family)
MKRVFSLLLICMLLPSFIFSAVRFSAIDLNSQNTLLFKVSADNPWNPHYEALFQASTDGSRVQILSCFPERMELLENGATLQIRNWFGTARFSAKNQALVWSSTTPIFEKGEPLVFNPPDLHLSSPDGNWSLYLRKTDVARAELRLVDEKNDIQAILATGIPYDTQTVPAKWSKDSSVFVYQKDGNVYFAEPSMFFAKIQIDEKYRTLGEGSINNVCFVADGSLVFASGRDLFSIPKNELYTRSLYASVVGSGKRIGYLPAEFDSQRDKFWFNNTGTAVLYVQDNANLWMYELKSAMGGKTAFVAPYVSLPSQAVSVDVFWTADNLPIIWVEQFYRGKLATLAFGMLKGRTQSGKTGYDISSLLIPLNSSKPALSPDGKKFSFCSGGVLYVYDSKTWLPLELYKEEKVHQYLWANDESLFVGGDETIRSWNINTKVQHVLFLSSARKFGFSANGQNVLAEAGGKVLTFNQPTGLWRISNEKIERKASSQNENVRVFIDDSKNGYYENAIYVRSVSGQSYTRPLLKEPKATTPGSYSAKKPVVALTFDASDSDAGLTQILAALAHNRVKGTFFINGEFMRRFPTGVQEIAASKHQCGSLFFTNIDFASSDYALDENFIMQGLARNEYDFFNLTGTDMSPIWHTPEYITNEIINSAGNKAGYEFVRQTVAPADWVTLEISRDLPGHYKSSCELASWIVSQLKNGAVISLQVGIRDGKRSDYLYDYLDELICAILSAGYDIVPYTQLKN